ncbi:DUF2071 domain-containing protein [Desulfurivibrio sp. C05AmB]|uniref:DUF2071 domain-containing protein n=1 Tax=Desulfurivibrio sp. C05AmB TaxID=3374371 RepID=UPI00376EC89F
MTLKNTLAHLLILNYPVPAALLAARIHPSLQLDTHGGTAWLSLLAFEQQRFAPLGRLGPSFNFPEVNYRTYVQWRQQRGVYFFRLDLGCAWLALISRMFFGMPCRTQPLDLQVEMEADNTYRSWRLHSPELVVAARSAGAATADSAWFLEPNHGFFTHRNGSLRYFQVKWSRTGLMAAKASIARCNFLEDIWGYRPAESPSASLINGLKLELVKFPPQPV